MNDNMENWFLNFCVKLYRTYNTKSRAVGPWTYYGSTGRVRKATCIFCRNVVATCCNDYPETGTFQNQANSHVRECAMYWLSGSLPNKGFLGLLKNQSDSPKE